MTELEKVACPNPKVYRNHFRKRYLAKHKGSGPKDCGRYEPVTIAYLTEYEGVDCSVRFDKMSLVAFGEDKVFLRHYVNALSDAIPDDVSKRLPWGSPKLSQSLRGTSPAFGTGLSTPQG